MTLRSANSGGEGNDACPKVAYGINPNGGEMHPCDKELAQTQTVCHQNGVMLTQSIGFKAGQSANGGLGDESEVSPTIASKPSALEPTVAHSLRIGSMTRRDRPTPPSTEVAQPLTSSDGNIGDNAPAAIIESLLAAMRYIVRRLTPTECERLQGLPDNYTIPTGLRRFFDANGEPSPELVSEFVDIFDKYNAIMAEYAHKKPPKGKSYKQVATWLKKVSDPATCPDSPRYKACGNGWATNQPRWLVLRILNQDGIDAFND